MDRLTSAFHSLRQRTSKDRECLKDPRNFTMGMARITLLSRGADLFNLPVSLSFNIFYYVLKVSWLQLFLGVTCFYQASTLFFTLMYWITDCRGDLEFGKVYFLVLVELLNGPSFVESLPTERRDQDTGCLFLSSVVIASSLVLSAFIFALAVKKFLVPCADVWFTKYLVQNTRDGVEVLQFRVANARGNLLTNVNLEARFVYFHRTIEGEQHGKTIEAEFTGPSYIFLPVTYSHVVNESSPLYGKSLETISGFIFIELTAYDTVLDEEVHKCWHYQLPDDLVLRSRFQDMMVGGNSFGRRQAPKTLAEFKEMVKHRPRADMDLFHRTIPLPPRTTPEAGTGASVATNSLVAPTNAATVASPAAVSPTTLDSTGEAMPYMLPGASDAEVTVEDRAAPRVVTLPIAEDVDVDVDGISIAVRSESSETRFLEQ